MNDVRGCSGRRRVRVWANPDHKPKLPSSSFSLWLRELGLGGVRELGLGGVRELGLGGVRELGLGGVRELCISLFMYRAAGGKAELEQTVSGGGAPDEVRCRLFRWVAVCFQSRGKDASAAHLRLL